MYNKIKLSKAILKEGTIEQANKNMRDNSKVSHKSSGIKVSSIYNMKCRISRWVCMTLGNKNAKSPKHQISLSKLDRFPYKGLLQLKEYEI